MIARCSRAAHFNVRPGARTRLIACGLVQRPNLPSMSTVLKAFCSSSGALHAVTLETDPAAGVGPPRSPPRGQVSAHGLAVARGHLIERLSRRRDRPGTATKRAPVCGAPRRGVARALHLPVRAVADRGDQLARRTGAEARGRDKKSLRREPLAARRSNVSSIRTTCLSRPSARAPRCPRGTAGPHTVE
jgi:hypothetical protein